MSDLRKASMYADPLRHFETMRTPTLSNWRNVAGPALYKLEPVFPEGWILRSAGRQSIY